jgi:hypothetical protein
MDFTSFSQARGFALSGGYRNVIPLFFPGIRVPLYSTRRDTMEIPVLSADLIVALDKEYPLKNPALDTTDRMLWRTAGRRDVVDMLLVSLENHLEDQMKKK